MSVRSLEVEVAVVGNGVAGWTCAKRLARSGHRPLLIGPGLPTDRPPLSKAALSGGLPRLFADSRTIESAGIVAVDGVVTAADLDGHVLTVTEDMGTSTVHARHIVLATGCSYDPVAVPGLLAAHVNATPEGLKGLLPRLKEPRRVVVVGAGLVGVESAITLRRAGHEV
uniref:FAD-dependent oxidoreductase n=1 Tax=Pseudonocardia pini TaxID=2758030 RepID=UPI0015F0E11B